MHLVFRQVFQERGFGPESDPDSKTRTLGFEPALRFNAIVARLLLTPPTIGFRLIGSATEKTNLDCYTRDLPTDIGPIHLFERGEGPALLLMHGMWGDWRDWEPVLEGLAEQHRVIAIDLPGFGDSAKPDADYAADIFIGALDAVIAQLDLRNVTLVGNSFGGLVALLYALARPECFARLVLVDTGGLHRWSEAEIIEGRQRYTRANILRLTPAFNELMFAPLFTQGPSAISRGYIAKQNAKLARPDFPQYARAIERSIAMALDLCLVARLHEIVAPTLLIHGAKDQIVPLAAVEAGARRFPRAELKVLSECGHVPQLECPGEVVEAISAFVAKPF